jgi:hypothetical protein
MLPPSHRDYSDFTIETKLAADVTPAEEAMLFALFDGAYRQANHAYLSKSLTKLKYLTIARAGGVPAGFGLAEMRVIDLPRLPGQPVAMAGMCCVDDRFRRRGLFRELERLSMGAAGVAPSGRMITCGRMAHPASFGMMTPNPSHIPKPGVAITPWQQAIGSVIAAEYGVADFDPATFVCHGSGEPIGYPVIEMDVREEDWAVFRPVNRDRGDSLLGMAWLPDAPEGWDDTSG